MQDSNQAKLLKSKTLDVAFSFGDCKICDEKASGIHYGVSTCEGIITYFL